MLQSVRDGNTVPIKYEAQLIKVKYDETLIGNIYYEGKIFNQVSDFMEYNEKKLGQTIADKTTDELINLSTIIGDKDRIKSLVELFIKHYNNRKDQLYGKAMYVAISREIAFQVYKEITNNKNFKHNVKLIVTNDSQDSVEMSHVVGTNKQRNEWIKEFKDKNSHLKIIIVVDMLLTGFDVPFLDVMYIDKPLRMHNLMQAIARVNRTYQDEIVKKDFGLIVDFIGLGKYLNEAIAAYTIAVKSHCTIQWIETVIDHLKDEYESLCNMFHKFDFSNFILSNSNERYTIIKKGYEYILEQDMKNLSKEKHFLNNFMKRAKLIEEGFKYAINKLDPKFRTKLSFFIALRAFANKNIYNQSIIPAKNFKNALKDILESAIVTKQLVTISNLDNENQIDILDPESVEKLIKDYPPRTLVEMITNWLKKEINLLASRNIVKSNMFQEKLLTIIESYNKISDPESMMHSIIELAKEINESKQKNLELDLTPEEEAFYDALCKPENIKREYDRNILITMAKELLANVNRNATVDWYKRKDVKATMRVEIRNLLDKYKYPPDHCNDATELIINQAEKHANKNITK